MTVNIGSLWFTKANLPHKYFPYIACVGKVKKKSPQTAVLKMFNEPFAE